MEDNFLEELLKEADQKEMEQTEAYNDLVLLQIKSLSGKIERNFSEADKECELIKNFALMKNAQLQEKIKFLELKLEAFIRERKEKTIELCNGIIKFHKKQAKVEITDLNLFLKNARRELLTIIPETVKSDMNKIKTYIKTKPVPPGVTITEGKEEFTYKLKEYDEEVNINAGEKETGTRIKQTINIRTAV